MQPLKTEIAITSSQIAFEYFKPYFNEFAEEFWMINLNHHLEPISLKMVHKGTLNKCEVYPRDLFREALHANSFAIIIAHNHVSQNLQPSLMDLKITKKLRKISLLVEIPLIDHLIFNKNKYFSFKENNLL